MAGAAMAGAASRGASNAVVPPAASAATSALSAAWPDARILITTNTIVVAIATPSSSHLTLMRPGAAPWSPADAATGVSDRVAEDASLLTSRRLAGRGANRSWLTLGAPTAASSGCVTVAANARLRAATQSPQILAPGGHSLAQIRHFMRPISFRVATEPPVTNGVFLLLG